MRASLIFMNICAKSSLTNQLATIFSQSQWPVIALSRPSLTNLTTPVLRFSSTIIGQPKPKLIRMSVRFLLSTYTSATILKYLPRFVFLSSITLAERSASTVICLAWRGRSFSCLHLPRISGVSTPATLMPILSPIKECNQRYWRERCYRHRLR